jgi:pimeloyl-ACP methyl ester carboxylesterase
VAYHVNGLTLVGERWRPATTSRGTVVLLHGSGQTHHAWRRTCVRLSADGWDCIALDTRGHGESSWAPGGDYSLDGLSADLLAVVRTLDDRPVLVGASLGGMTALVAEADHHVASRLVLVDITARVERAGSQRIDDFMSSAPDGFATLDDAADAIRRYNPRKRDINLDGLRKNLRLGEDGRWRWHWDPRLLQHREEAIETELLARTRRALSVVDVPTLVVRGLTSEVLTAEGATYLLSLIPHASLVEVNAGHMVAGDDNDVFGSRLASFLDAPA